MKLPFNIILGPLLKPRLANTEIFCQHPVFAVGVFYTYLYSFLGLFISANHLRHHLGESPQIASEAPTCGNKDDNNFMMVHDLKIIATAMGIVQYACVLVGCFTENPALFLPHLTAQIIVVAVKLINALLLITPLNFKSSSKLRHKLPSIMLLTFNWLQEFCVFRQYLRICDL